MSARHAPAPRLTRRLAAAVAVGSLTASLLAGCSGSSGVELGDDWAGSETFVVATVSGLTTVLGVNPQRHRAEPLLVVPQHRDDDPVLAPQIVRLPGASDSATWVLAVPRRGDGRSRLYRFSPADRTLTAAGDVEAGRTLVPNGPHGLAGIGSTARDDTAGDGAVDSDLAGNNMAGNTMAGSGATGDGGGGRGDNGSRGDGSGPDDTALRYAVRLDQGSQQTLTVRDDVSLTGASGYVSGGADGVCATSDTAQGTVVQRLAPSSTTPRAWQLAGVRATAVDCAGARTVVGAQPMTDDAAPTGTGSAGAGPTTAGPTGMGSAVAVPTSAGSTGASRAGSTLRLEDRDGVEVVISGSDLVARVLDTPDGVLAATQGPHGCAIQLLSRSTGQVTARVTLRGLSTIDAVASTRHGFVVIGADRAVAVTRDLRAVKVFDLPAPVTATP